MSYSILDIIIMGGGFYLLWSAVNMKTKGTIPGMLVTKGMDLNRAKDIPGFIRSMLMPTFVMGFCAVLSGGMGIAAGYVPQLSFPQLILMVITFVLLVTYGYLDVRAQKKYLGVS